MAENSAKSQSAQLCCSTRYANTWHAGSCMPPECSHSTGKPLGQAFGSFMLLMHSNCSKILCWSHMVKVQYFSSCIVSLYYHASSHIFCTEIHICNQAMICKIVVNQIFLKSEAFMSLIGINSSFQFWNFNIIREKQEYI